MRHLPAVGAGGHGGGDVVDDRLRGRARRRPGSSRSVRPWLRRRPFAERRLDAHLCPMPPAKRQTRRRSSSLPFKPSRSHRLVDPGRTVSLKRSWIRGGVAAMNVARMMAWNAFRISKQSTLPVGFLLICLWKRVRGRSPRPNEWSVHADLRRPIGRAAAMRHAGRVDRSPAPFLISPSPRAERGVGECPERQRGRTVNPLAMPS